LETLYTQFGWDLYKRFGHAYEAFKIMVCLSLLSPWFLTLAQR
jgi:translation initiation factor 2 alpha subunit (eIF-2alpha)